MHSKDRDELAARRRVRGHLQIADLKLEGVALKDADVIVVHHAEDWDMETLQDMTALTGKVVIGLAEGMTLETLDEDDMREAGWVRVHEGSK